MFPRQPSTTGSPPLIFSLGVLLFNESVVVNKILLLLSYIVGRAPTALGDIHGALKK